MARPCCRTFPSEEAEAMGSRTEGRRKELVYLSMCSLALDLQCSTLPSPSLRHFSECQVPLLMFLKGFVYPGDAHTRKQKHPVPLQHCIVVPARAGNCTRVSPSHPSAVSWSQLGLCTVCVGGRWELVVHRAQPLLPFLLWLQLLEVSRG